MQSYASLLGIFLMNSYYPLSKFWIWAAIQNIIIRHCQSIGSNHLYHHSSSRMALGFAYLSRLPLIFPGAPLNSNKHPGNIQGNLERNVSVTLMQYMYITCTHTHTHTHTRTHRSTYTHAQTHNNGIVSMNRSKSCQIWQQHNTTNRELWCIIYILEYTWRILTTNQKHWIIIENITTAKQNTTKTYVCPTFWMHEQPPNGSSWKIFMNNTKIHYPLMAQYKATLGFTDFIYRCFWWWCSNGDVCKLWHLQMMTYL